MIRGEYESWDKKNGIWIKTPNLFTLVGWNQLLLAAFQGVAFEWDVGLCNTTPAVDGLTLAGIGEPTGASDYARQSLDAGDTNWPDVDEIENTPFVRSREFTFPASGEYSAPVTRLFMTDGVDVISVSSAFAESTLFDAPSTHRYTLYFR